jgi:hypothetical protein
LSNQPAGWIGAVAAGGLSALAGGEVRYRWPKRRTRAEIALLSAVLEFGRRKGVLETNPCRDIKYNKTRPGTRYVTPANVPRYRPLASRNLASSTCCFMLIVVPIRGER